MRPEPRNVTGLTEVLGRLATSLEVDPSPRNVMKVAEAFWMARQPGRAVSLLEALVTGNPRLIAPHVLLGWCYQDLGRAGEAESAFETIRELDPSNPYIPEPPEEEEGEELESIATDGSEEEAEPEQALTLEELSTIPPSPLYSATLAGIFERQGFEEKAIEIYREILRLHPEREELAEKIRLLEERASGEPRP